MSETTNLSEEPALPLRACIRCGNRVEAGCLLAPSFAALGNILNANDARW
jgi:hypothetical protein